MVTIEEKELNLPTFPSQILQPLSWRLWHSINFMIGAVTYFLGSVFYYPSFEKNYDGDMMGAWLYTIGSVGFVFADLTEWNFYRTGCIGSYYLDPIKIDYSLNAKYKRAEMGINFSLSVIGNIWSLVGSVMFIPGLNSLILGEKVFFVGMAMVAFS